MISEKTDGCGVISEKTGRKRLEGRNSNHASEKAEAPERKSCGVESEGIGKWRNSNNDDNDDNDDNNIIIAVIMAGE